MPGCRGPLPVPVYAELFEWLGEWAPQVPPKTPLGQVLAYARHRGVRQDRTLTLPLQGPGWARVCLQRL